MQLFEKHFLLNKLISHFLINKPIQQYLDARENTRRNIYGEVSIQPRRNGINGEVFDPVCHLSIY